MLPVRKQKQHWTKSVRIFRTDIRIENFKITKDVKFKLGCSEKIDVTVKIVDRILITFKPGGDRSRNKKIFCGKKYLCAKKYFTGKIDMLSLRRQIQHWHFSILIIAMYWNLQGIVLQFSRDTERIIGCAKMNCKIFWRGF